MMKYFIGVKIVKACPEVKDGKEGYRVEYEDGYQSWSPKDVFEKAYFFMGENNNNMVTQDMVDLFMGNTYSQQLDDKSLLITANTLSGFKQHEVSSCVDPANFNVAIGEEIGRERISDTLWKCLGFVVQWGKFGLHK